MIDSRYIKANVYKDSRVATEDLKAQFKESGVGSMNRQQKRMLKKKNNK